MKIYNSFEIVDAIADQLIAAHTVTIKKDNNGEYRVPGPDGTEAQAYYTDDKDDAYDTAAFTYGATHNIKFRTIPGDHKS